MKKMVFLALAIALCSTGFAQYKKTGSLGRSRSRTVGFGATGMHFSNNATGVGIYYEGSREHDDRAFFTYGTVSVLLPFKFSYTTPGINYQNNDVKDVKVSSKSSVNVQYSYNFGFFLVNNQQGDNKIRPYLSIGLTVLAGTGTGDNPTTVSDINYSIDHYPEDVGIYVGGRASAGAVCQLAGRTALKVDAGYVVLMSPLTNPNNNMDVHTLSNHIAVSAGLRFAVGRR
ncbi:MAG: hypothetical protein KGO82_16275 [Bacteroidota bacterium]|nr:hypothetical protein [Bacteroidota bacterium]